MMKECDMHGLLQESLEFWNMAASSINQIHLVYYWFLAESRNLVVVSISVCSATLHLIFIKVLIWTFPGMTLRQPTGTSTRTPMGKEAKSTRISSSPTSIQVSLGEHWEEIKKINLEIPTTGRQPLWSRQHSSAEPPNMWNRFLGLTPSTLPTLKWAPGATPLILYWGLDAETQMYYMEWDFVWQCTLHIRGHPYITLSFLGVSADPSPPM